MIVAIVTALFAALIGIVDALLYSIGVKHDTSPSTAWYD